MKTILYNPIFINPQAYYVFPQLYDIEKGDSFIEPAVYSGYLLIEDLISNTSSQVTDTREVDFTQFAGKRIRISQYTNIGAVVLGEWLLPEFDGKVTIPEPDVYYDLSLKDNSSPTRNIIDDLSGNGHDAEIFNAAYTESSGYRSDGAFVFDSIDDYAIMQNVTKGFKTLFMEVMPSITTDKGGFLYDQRVGQTSFGIRISLNHIAYNTYNWGGVTYINGKLNTTMNGKEVYLKHQIITIVNGTDLKPQKVVLGGDIGLAGYFSNMALYKLIGFYDELTPLQIEKVINDYKLKYD